ncbi:hypothetical protein CBW65_02595 [Tumebacillus avium]|uniref:Knr4/Smi1-like domain-containing protein n=1 Tax=Tumebacillus avium TaxID=1903704 RepID=A0A1Y0II02_9BACL|nr:SMI1/KNR4 family protein [Tumebacillus avium]ARU60077.1 hypothetical protein CBW65_02595 [Tumebacillus avium]
MADFSFLKKYVLNEKEDNPSQWKHSFYSLQESEVLEAESRISRVFPGELRSFYLEIGYGFLCNQSKQGFNRLMDPMSVADFRLGEDIYEFDPDRELYDNVNSIIFFEVSEGTYLTMDLSQEEDNSDCKIYYFGKVIANNLEEFLRRMDTEPNYFI